MRTRLATIALALLAAAPMPAHATPFAGHLGTASTLVRLRGTDGKTYEVTFAATALTPQSGAASYWLDIAIARCVDGSCAAAKRYTTSLSAGQITANADMSDVTVKVTTLGAPLTIVWTANSDSSAAVPRVRAITPVIDFTLEVNARPTDADTRATVWGASCHAKGTAQDSYLVSADGYAPDSGPTPPKSLPVQFAKRSGKRVACVA